MYGTLSLLDTPLSKRSDDDQEMKIWRPAHFWTAAARRAAAAHKYYYHLAMTMVRGGRGRVGVGATLSMSAQISHRTTPHPPPRRLLLHAAIILSAILLRILVGFHPHSGQDDYQGPTKNSRPPIIITTTPHNKRNDQRPTRPSSSSKYGGDYEAQRHWMEITYHLPISEWYYHDLEYWGLDYPPLTAYASYVFGWVAHSVGGLTLLLPNNDDDDDDDASFSEINEGDGTTGVCDERHSEVVCIDKMQTISGSSRRRKVSKGLGVLRDMVALHSSRWGFEQSGGKIYMRFTVLLCDILIYMSAVWVLAKRVVDSEVEERDFSPSTNNDEDATQNTARTPQQIGVSSHTWLLLTALCQPAIVLIDHGHFQYNTVSLGLALWSFHYITITTTNSSKADDRMSCPSSSSSFMGPIWGSFLFSLALNFKQMELYHAPAVFAYLLGRCFRHDDGTLLGTNRSHSSMWMVLRRFIALGVTVLLTFTLLWLPFAMSSQSNNTAVAGSLDGVVQILVRLFPFHRGVFEGKVANLWCALSIKPFSIRDRVPSTLLPVAALGLTLALILPSCYILFRVGRGDSFDRDVDANVDCNNPPLQMNQLRITKGSGIDDLRILLWGTASTSLAFFLASYQVHEKGILIPLAPMSLLMVDTPNFILFFSILAAWSLWPLLVIDRLVDAYVCCIVIFLCINSMARLPSSEPTEGDTDMEIFSDRYITGYFPKLAYVVMIILHILEATVIPPSKLPDLFPVLWSFAGCGMFCVSFIGTLHAMVKQCNRSTRCKRKTRRKVSSISTVSSLGIIFLICATSEGFLHPPLRCINAPTFSADMFMSNGNDATGDIITNEFLTQAHASLEWECMMAKEAMPVLNLSVRESDTTFSVSTSTDTDELVDQGVDDWLDGSVWKATEQHLVDMGILAGTETNRTLELTSHRMLTSAPQLYRLPTSHVIDAATFLLSYPSLKQSVDLIEADPSLLTYLADDLQYGLCEYLPNMMFMGSETIAAQTIEMQLSRSPSFALQLIRMAVDGGIEERSVSRALGSAAKASGKAVEGIVGDMGRSLREWKQTKGGKGSLER